MLPPTAPSARRSAANWKRASKNSALHPSTNGAPSRRRFPPPNRMAREKPSAPDEHGRPPPTPDRGSRRLTIPPGEARGTAKPFGPAGKRPTPSPRQKENVAPSPPA